MASTPARRPATPRPAADSGSVHPVDQPTTAQVNAAVTSFALLADPTRVRILWALREDAADVASLAEIAGCRATAASQHLSKLRLAGLVEGDRQGRRVLYRLRGGHVRNLLTEALFHADHPGQRRTGPRLTPGGPQRWATDRVTRMLRRGGGR